MCIGPDDMSNLVNLDILKAVRSLKSCQCQQLKVIAFYWGKVEGNSGSYEKIWVPSCHISMQGITQPSSREDTFQDLRLNDSRTSTENMDNGSDVVGGTNELLESYKPKLVQHEETNINDPIEG
ncbi:hypothetical protein SUGI_0563030 [Cryptomeria japonica]|nr:hypothetical protein SUGI_0563030 [Cryptomeria japonica]